MSYLYDRKINVSGIFYSKHDFHDYKSGVSYANSINYLVQSHKETGFKLLINRRF